MKIKYRHRLGEIMRVLLPDHPGLSSHKVIDELSENFYNYEGRSYGGTYDETEGILVLHITQKHRGNRLKENEIIPLVFRVSKPIRVVFSEYGKPMLTRVFLVTE